MKPTLTSSLSGELLYNQLVSLLTVDPDMFVLFLSFVLFTLFLIFSSQKAGALLLSFSSSELSLLLFVWLFWSSSELGFYLTPPPDCFLEKDHKEHVHEVDGRHMFVQEHKLGLAFSIIPALYRHALQSFFSLIRYVYIYLTSNACLLPACCVNCLLSLPCGVLVLSVCSVHLCSYGCASCIV